MSQTDIPVWLDERGHLNEVAFAREYLAVMDMICVDGAFFTTEGRVEDENQMRCAIYRALSEYITTGLPRKVERIMDVLRMESYHGSLPHSEDVIHVSNGSVVLGISPHLKPSFTRGKGYCRYRMQVDYNEQAPEPVRWKQFLNQLLEETDILTLQEYMGYCLVPTTRAQKMLIITGRGGEGKSRIGVVMKALLGCNMGVGSVAKLESSPFARADLQHLLVMVDDDLKMEALSQTNNIKSIVTAEIPMDLERKGIQSYQGLLYCRLMAFGNGTLQALHDRSYGFFRRQIILSAKPRDPDRVDDPYLADALKKELEGIFLWCLEGLDRLQRNHYRFTLSSQAIANMEASVTEGNNVISFLESDGYFRLEPEATASSRALYQVYRDWCEDNSFTPLSSRSFLCSVKDAACDYGLTASHHIPIGNGKQARGYRGIRLLSRF